MKVRLIKEGTQTWECVIESWENGVKIWVGKLGGKLKPTTIPAAFCPQGVDTKIRELVAEKKKEGFVETLPQSAPGKKSKPADLQTAIAQLSDTGNGRFW